MIITTRENKGERRWRDKLKTRHGGNRPDDDIVVAIHQYGGGDAQRVVNHAAVLFDGLPEG